MEEGEKCGEYRSIGEEEHIGRIARIFVLKSLSPMKFGTWTFMTGCVFELFGTVLPDYYGGFSQVYR